MKDLREMLAFNIERHLQPSEKVWWIGKPRRQFFILTPKSFFVIPMILALIASIFAAWCAFLLDFNWKMIALTGLIALPIFSILPFLRLSDSWLDRLSQTYIVTSQRVLILHGGRLRTKTIEASTKITRPKVPPHSLEFDRKGVVAEAVHNRLHDRRMQDKLVDLRPFTFLVLQDADFVANLVAAIQSGADIGTWSVAPAEERGTQ